MEYVKTYLVHADKRRINRLETFLEKIQFKDISEPVNKKHYQFINNQYAKIDQLYQKELVLNIYFKENTMTLQTTLDGDKEHLKNTIKFLKLLFNTCYTIIKNDDYQTKKWHRMKKKLEHKNKKHLSSMYRRASKVTVGNMSTDEELISFLNDLDDIFDL